MSECGDTADNAREEAERRARRKARRRKPETDKSKGKTEMTVPSSSSDDDDVIGKTKVIYLEDPKVARMTPTRSEPMEKIPLEEDEDIGSDDVEQENKGLTEEEREEPDGSRRYRTRPGFQHSIDNRGNKQRGGGTYIRDC